MGSFTEENKMLVNIIQTLLKLLPFLRKSMRYNNDIKGIQGCAVLKGIS